MKIAFHDTGIGFALTLTDGAVMSVARAEEHNASTLLVSMPMAKGHVTVTMAEEEVERVGVLLLQHARECVRERERELARDRQTDLFRDSGERGVL